MFCGNCANECSTFRWPVFSSCASNCIECRVKLTYSIISFRKTQTADYCAVPSSPRRPEPESLPGNLQNQQQQQHRHHHNMAGSTLFAEGRFIHTDSGWYPIITCTRFRYVFECIIMVGCTFMRIAPTTHSLGASDFRITIIRLLQCSQVVGKTHPLHVHIYFGVCTCPCLYTLYRLAVLLLGNNILRRTCLWETWGWVNEKASMQLRIVWAHERMRFFSLNVDGNGNDNETTMERHKT